jgi:hypothetical protein
MIKDETQLKKVYDAYTDIGKYTSLKVHRYDYSDTYSLPALIMSLLENL